MGEIINNNAKYDNLFCFVNSMLCEQNYKKQIPK